MVDHSTRAPALRHGLAVSAIGLLCLSAHAAGTPLLAADQKVAGDTQSQWTRAWWQWAASFDRSNSPVADPTGEFCAADQRGPVWFLAGTYGTRRTVRACTVPAGKYLFFPLINYLTVPRPNAVVSCADVVQDAKGFTEGATHLVLRVDHRVIEGLDSHRVASAGCFDLGKRQVPPVVVYPAAADGYYAMLKPLAPGRHTIEFGGILPTMMQAVSYTIDVR